ncbi:hypothetical protein BJX70DRAFT_396934 [Aspergillus crustosus]
MAKDDITQETHPWETSQVSEGSAEGASATTDSVLALSLLIGIACICWYMDNKPLSTWDTRLSLNATVSILTTACTTLLMHGVSSFIGQLKWLYFESKKPQKLAHFETFDAASRGVWGSVLLLTTTRWNQATIGAFVTILRLAFSPFTQQVILIEQRNVITAADSATFGYAHNYSSDGMRGLANTRAASIQQDPSMQSAIIRGLYGINTTEPFNCPTACRWPGSYISLGFKSTCRNVTEETLRGSSCERVPEGFQVWRQCNMTTPAGLDVSSRWTDTDSGTNYYMNTSTLVDLESDSNLPNTCLDSNTTPALEIGAARLTALANFFQSSNVVSDWIEGNAIPTDIGLAAALIGNVNLTARFDSMATAMTESLRYGQDTITAHGETMVGEPFVSIRWGYFVVPIMTEGFAILFAVASILSNRRSRQVPLWKSSSLAVLALRPNERLGLLQGFDGDIKEITAAAEKTKVRLQ